MTAAVELSKTYHRQFGVGARFTLEDGYRARPDIHPKTLRNTTAYLVRADVLRRIGHGEYEVVPMPPWELQDRINKLGDPGYYRHANLSGPRSRIPKHTAAKQRKLNDKWREPLFDEQHGICALCGLWMVHPIHSAVDHNVPLADGGEDTPANLVLMHHACNLAKSTKGHAEAQDYLESIGHGVTRSRASKAFDNGIRLGATCERNWYDN